MTELMDLLEGQLSETVLETLTSNLHTKNQEQTLSATTDAMSVLINAMARNASSPKGASSIGAALERDHDGSILDDIMGALTGSAKPQSKTMDGEGILGHILGGNLGGIVDMLSRKSGMKSSQTLSLLIKLAPILMGALGRVKKIDHVDTNGLPDILSNAADKMNKQNKSGNILESFLDQDGDGNLNNEIKKVGFSFLKSLFGR